MIQLSVVVPVKEEPGLLSFLHDLHSALIDLFGRDGYEILIQQENGLGKALWTGMQKAKALWILTIDGDGQHDPQDIHKLWNQRGNADIVIGGKPRQGDSRSIFRQLASKAYYRYVKPSTLDIKDLGSNFRLYTKSFVMSLQPPYPTGFKFLQWILLKAAIRNLRIVEVPVSFRRRLTGKSKLSYTQELIQRFSKT